MSQIAVESTLAPWLLPSSLFTSAAMDVASYRDQLEVLDSSSCMAALSSSTSGVVGRQQQQHARDRIVILKVRIIEKERGNKRKGPKRKSHVGTRNEKNWSAYLLPHCQLCKDNTARKSSVVDIFKNIFCFGPPRVYD